MSLKYAPGGPGIAFSDRPWICLLEMAKLDRRLPLLSYVASELAHASRSTLAIPEFRGLSICRFSISASRLEQASRDHLTGGISASML